MDRFWSKVRKTEDCWIWTACKYSEGYGKIKIDGRVQRAHRVSWQMHYGDIPDGLFVCHKCDVRDCVRPSHLFLGTHFDNMADMADKGRSAPQVMVGESNPASKLTEKDVTQIRAKYEPYKTSMKALAEKYDVSTLVISKVIHRKTWRHVA